MAEGDELANAAVEISIEMDGDGSRPRAKREWLTLTRLWSAGRAARRWRLAGAAAALVLLTGALAVHAGSSDGPALALAGGPAPASIAPEIPARPAPRVATPPMLHAAKSRVSQPRGANRRAARTRSAKAQARTNLHR